MFTLLSRVSAYDFMMRPLEWAGLHTLRRFLLAHARGNVLEIGAGTWANLPLYPKECRLTAIDTDLSNLGIASQKPGWADWRGALSQMDAQKLGFASAAFDTVVITLALCSVNEPEMALREVGRVLKPGGQLLLLEHVSSSNRLVRHLQDSMNPIWHTMTKGCNLNRDTGRAVRGAGFKVTYERKLLEGSLLFSVAQK